MNKDTNQIKLEIADMKNNLIDRTSPENSSSNKVAQNSKYFEKKISILGYCWGGIIAYNYQF
jgi:dienelactone hydrolase